MYTINIGNTNACVFDHTSNKVSPLNDFDYKKKDQIIYSSVLKENDLKIKYPSVNFSQFKNARDFLSETSFLEMPIKYETSTIGIDRVLCAYYCFKNNFFNSLVIDAGTFTTIDFVSKKGFETGFILPGLKLLIENYTKGSSLPLISTLDITPLTSMPKNSNEALGKTLYAFHDSIISLFDYDHLFLTGGNSKKVKDAFGLEGQVRDNLIHNAMKYLA